MILHLLPLYARETAYSVKQLVEVIAITLLCVACSPNLNRSEVRSDTVASTQSPSDAQTSVGPASTEAVNVGATSTTQRDVTDLRIIPEMPPPAPEPNAREISCGLYPNKEADYGEIAELDFDDPASFDILDCINSGASKFSFHLNFMAADTLVSQGKYCAAGEYLTKGMQTSRLLEFAMLPSPRREAVTLSGYDWYPKKLCDPRARFERIVVSVAKGCGEQANFQYLNGIQSELKQLPQDNLQWEKQLSRYGHIPSACALR